jgi:hypothetical protein
VLSTTFLERLGCHTTQATPGVLPGLEPLPDGAPGALPPTPAAAAGVTTAPGEDRDAAAPAALTPEREAVLALARAKGFPRLFYRGQGVGSGERVWRAFVETCHARWLPLAEAQLTAYTPGGPEPRPDPEADAAAQACADRAGKLQTYFQEHGHAWDAAEHARRLDILRKRHAELDAALVQSGRALEHYGWTVTPGGTWHRIGEEPAPEATPEREQLLRDTLETAGALLAGAGPIDSPEWTAAEAAVSDAYANGDLDALAQACGALLALARGYHHPQGDTDGATARSLFEAGGAGA